MAEVKVTVNVGDLLDFLDEAEGGLLYPKIEEDDIIESVQMVGYTEVEFTIGSEDYGAKER